MILDNKTILVTGGTGSFGQKFTEIVLSEHNPKAIRIFSRGEFLQDEMRQKYLGHSKLRFFIGDVRDKERLSRAMRGVDIVVHAAALKQVPACEYNPIEAVRTNIDGASNVINAAIDCKVEKVMAISSDKAVYPTNLYGATKLVAEKLFVQANAYVGYGDTRFSCVRYGNVMNSRGSCIPLFIKQREQGRLTITDERMTRFWFTLEQAVHFVIDSIAIMCGGEVFVPKIPSMKVSDVAEIIAPGAAREYIGIRPGEKLHETLITEEESRHTKDRRDYYLIEPQFPFWNKYLLERTKLISEAFEYKSDACTATRDEFIHLMETM